MHGFNSQWTGIPDNILDSINILLLEKFKMYNSKNNNLFCSYMTNGQKYENELLIIGRQTTFWPEDFSVGELLKRGPEYIFKTKVRYHAMYGNDSLCPLSYVTDLWGDTENRFKYNTSYNTSLDPFWGCAKEIIMKLRICGDDTNWSSYIALSYLYKIAYSSNRYLPYKPRMMQFEQCREMFQLELSILKPKRILFLTGMKYAQDFLALSQSSDWDDKTWNIKDHNFEFHKAHVVVAPHPKKCKRELLVKEIISAFG